MSGKVRAMAWESNVLLTWLGSGTGIVGALFLAANQSWSRWGFLFLLVSSLSWTKAAKIRRDEPLVLLNLVFSVVNVFSIYNHFFKVWLN